MEKNNDLKLERKFIGSILGSVIGDALGARFEGHSHHNFPDIYLNSLFNDPDLIVGKYTDDSQMMKGILESLIKNKGFNESDMAFTFVRNFDISRGYGIGTIRVLEAIRSGADWKEVAKNSFGGQGSLGNGAAMRVCPIGLLYNFDILKVSKIAAKTALITHKHPLGIEGAVLQAQAVTLALKEDVDDFNSQAFLQKLIELGHTSTYENKLSRIAGFLEAIPNDFEVIKELGNKITALESVPTAIYVFLKNYKSGYERTIIDAIKLGGDTDTIACMTGAIAGAFHSIDKLPKNFVETVEEKDIFIKSAQQLFLLSKALVNKRS
ncbi:MAG: ADP-ribosylglycohydrolase family protein [Candidatus Hodarchaeota archaeon]